MGRVGTHGGGGYIAVLGFEQESAARLIDELKAHKWIDPYSRAVFVEMSVYNGNINILSVVALSLEFTPSNGALPRIDVFSLRLYRYFTAFQLAFLVCEAVFVGFVVQLIYRVVGQICEEGKSYFASVWNFSDLFLILFSLMTIGLYGARAANLAKAIKNIQNDANVFNGFYSIALSDNLVAYMSCLVFIVPVIQFLKFLKFNKDFMVFYSTLGRIQSDLGGFTVIMFVSLVIFSFWGFVMLRTKDENYATFTSALGNMISLIMGTFNFRILSQSRELGPMFTYAFTFVNMFLFLNILLCIITIGFKDARADERFQKSEYEVVAFIIYRIKGFLGLLPPYIPPPPKIVPMKVSYISEQWLLNTSYITQNQVRRMDKFANDSYVEDFLNDFQLWACLLGISYQAGSLKYFMKRLQDRQIQATISKDDVGNERNENFQECRIPRNGAQGEKSTDGELVRHGSFSLDKYHLSTNGLLNERESSTVDSGNPAEEIQTTNTIRSLPKNRNRSSSLRRQLLKESLKNTRRSSCPGNIHEAIRFVSVGKDVVMSDHIEEHLDVPKQMKPDTSITAMKLISSHLKDELVSHDLKRRSEETSACRVSTTQRRDEPPGRYRCAIANEPASGIREVFVKSAFSAIQFQQQHQTIERRRWSLQTEVPISLATAVAVKETLARPGTSQLLPRPQKKTRNGRPRSVEIELTANEVSRNTLISSAASKTTRHPGKDCKRSTEVNQRNVATLRSRDASLETVHTLIADLLPGAETDRNQRRRYSKIIQKPEEFLRLLALP